MILPISELLIGEGGQLLLVWNFRWSIDNYLKRQCSWSWTMGETTGLLAFQILNAIRISSFELGGFQSSWNGNGHRD